MDSWKIRVREGEEVRKAWDRLVDWVESLKIVTTDDVLVRETPNGISVKVVDSVTFSHPFLAMASFTLATISPGTVNNLVPVMKDSESRDLRRLDGRDDKGVINDKGPPRMEIDPKKCSKDGRVFLCVRVKALVAVAGKKPELTNKDVEIVQTDSPSGPKDGNGYYPIAIIHLSQDRDAVSEVFQVTHHNLQYAFQERNANTDELKEAPERKTIGRHLFYPA